MDERRIRELQKDGPWLAVCGDKVRSVEPGSPLREGEKVVQVYARGLRKCVAAMRHADRWLKMSEDEQEALLEADVETYGRLKLAARKVRPVSDEEYYGG
jgi:hypothetical protein